MNLKHVFLGVSLTSMVFLSLAGCGTMKATSAPENTN
jgi:hypothetical protein